MNVQSNSSPSLYWAEFPRFRLPVACVEGFTTGQIKKFSNQRETSLFEITLEIKLKRTRWWMSSLNQALARSIHCSKTLCQWDTAKIRPTPMKWSYSHLQTQLSIDWTCRSLKRDKDCWDNSRKVRMNKNSWSRALRRDQFSQVRKPLLGLTSWASLKLP